MKKRKLSIKKHIKRKIDYQTRTINVKTSKLKKETISKVENKSTVEIRRELRTRNSPKKQNLNELIFLNNERYEHIVVTPFYMREEILRIFLRNLQNLKENISLHAILIGSNTIKDEKKIINDFGFDYVYHKNIPLSNKWNFGVNLLKNVEFDKLVILGSDDIVSSNLFLRLSKKIDEGYEMSGVLDIYYHDFDKKEDYYWGGYHRDSKRFNEPIGAGRFYSAELLKKLNYKLWSSNINSGLDGDVYRRVDKSKIYTTKLMNDEFLVDIKNSKTQKTPIKLFKDVTKLPKNFKLYYNELNYYG